MAQHTTTAVHRRNWVEREILVRRLRLISVTTAITVVTGVTRKNHNIKSSAKLRCGQKGIPRSIGNETRNKPNPSRAGAQNASTGQTLIFGKVDSSDVAMLQHSDTILVHFPGVAFSAVERELLL